MTETPAIKMVALRLRRGVGADRQSHGGGTVPEDAPETIIQPGKPETAQKQEAAVWMATVTIPPEAGACNVVGETE